MLIRAACRCHDGQLCCRRRCCRPAHFSYLPALYITSLAWAIGGVRPDLRPPSPSAPARRPSCLPAQTMPPFPQRNRRRNALRIEALGPPPHGLIILPDNACNLRCCHICLNSQKNHLDTCPNASLSGFMIRCIQLVKLSFGDCSYLECFLTPSVT